MSVNLLQTWLTNQFADQGNSLTSHMIFNNYDRGRSPEDHLFVEGTSVNEIVNGTLRKWYPIIDGLQDKLDSNESLTTLDLRHIEFLAHSIKVDSLMKIIQAKSKN